jgi:hypothetical protein
MSLASGFSLSDLMFGRSVRTSLGSPVGVVVDYDVFDHKDTENKQLEKA